jgi:hypothetical protein
MTKSYKQMLDNEFFASALAQRCWFAADLRSDPRLRALAHGGGCH